MLERLQAELVNKRPTLARGTDLLYYIQTMPEQGNNPQKLGKKAPGLVMTGLSTGFSTDTDTKRPLDPGGVSFRQVLRSREDEYAMKERAALDGEDPELELLSSGNPAMKDPKPGKNN